MKTFNKNKRYVFDKETALQNEHFKANYDSGNIKYWSDYCNGKEVEIISSKEGYINDYLIVPEWCILKEV